MDFFAPGYKKLENREQRKKEVEQALEGITPTRQEVEGQKEDDLECELQLSPLDVDKVLVNGIELAKDSALATLRAACSFPGISGSGSKLRVYTRIFNHNKKMELLNAKSLVSEAKAQETRVALGQSVAKMSGEATQARHRLTHMPCSSWCMECFEHRARPDRHERTDEVKRESIPEVSFGFSAIQEEETQKQSQQEQYVGRLQLTAKLDSFMLCH